MELSGRAAKASASWQRPDGLSVTDYNEDDSDDDVVCGARYRLVLLPLPP